MTITYRYYPTYLDFYHTNISQPLAAIDSFLKSEQAFSIETVAHLLHISHAEVCYLLQQKKITHWSAHVFLNIMVSGSSHVCQFYKREVETGYLEQYDARSIAYIYNLDISLVQDIFRQLDTRWVASWDIGEILSKISVFS